MEKGADRRMEGEEVRWMVEKKKGKGGVDLNRDKSGIFHVLEG